MMQDNISWLGEMPFCAICSFELRCEFGKPAVTKNDYVNNNFLEDVKSLYDHDNIFNNLNFNYYTMDAILFEWTL